MAHHMICAFFEEIDRNEDSYIIMYYICKQDAALFIKLSSTRVWIHIGAERFHFKYSQNDRSVLKCLYELIDMFVLLGVSIPIRSNARLFTVLKQIAELSYAYDKKTLLNQFDLEADLEANTAMENHIKWHTFIDNVTRQVNYIKENDIELNIKHISPKKNEMITNNEAIFVAMNIADYINEIRTHSKLSWKERIRWLSEKNPFLVLLKASHLK